MVKHEGAARGSANRVQSLFYGCVFLLTVEVLFPYGSSFFTYGGGAVSRKDQTQFPDGGNRKQERANQFPP